MGSAEFRLPDVGEGLTEAEVLRWHVAAGDVVAVNDVLVEVETAKSAVELPSPFAGRVLELLVPEGRTVAVGTALVRVQVDGEAADATGSESAGQGSADASPESGSGSGGTGRRQVLVGYGPETDDRPRRRLRRRGRRSGTVAAGTKALHGAFSTGKEVPRPVAPPSIPSSQDTGVHPAEPGPSAEEHLPEPGDFGPPAGQASPGAAPQAEQPHREPRPTHARAKPPVRRLARDLDVDLELVPGSGPEGVVTREDVVAAAAGGSGTPDRGWSGLPREEREPVRSVRRATAASVVASVAAAPHATVWRTLDVTESMALLRRLREQGGSGEPEPRLTLLHLLGRVMCLVLPRSPMLNARWEDSPSADRQDAPEGSEAGATIVRQHYVNLGIATATERGLLVPVVRDAHTLNLPDLARAIGVAVEAARSGASTPADLTGGTISITNVGSLGVDGGAAVLPLGQSAIVALGRVSRQPWVVTGDDPVTGRAENVQARWVVTLSVTFDHRVVDGAEAGAFLSDVADVLADPRMALVF